MRQHWSDHWLSVGILVSACLAILGSGATDATIALHYVFKPLTTILIFGVAWRAVTAVPRYRRMILLGIAFSCCGDIFLMLPPSLLATGFLLGLSSFLIAHLCFLYAFSLDTRLLSKPAVLLLLGAIGTVIVAFIWPGLNADLKAPVVVYLICLVAMATQAITRQLRWHQYGCALAAVGGVVFMLSDSLLALNKFHAPLVGSGWLILGTYYSALLLIAHSVRFNTVKH
ncbi:MAG: lysoplasmalogenase [Herbaspirillum sp.]